jgi:hypothetical protein
MGLVPALKTIYFSRGLTCSKGPDDAAVAGDDDAAVAGDDDAQESDDEWDWQPQHTMHPFWAVRRLTGKQLAQELAKTEPGKTRPRFNCKIDVHTMSCVTVGVVNSQAVNTTRMCDVPFLTNSIEVAQGEELIMEVGQRKVATAEKRTWKQAFLEEERQTKANAEKEAKAEKERSNKEV